MQEREEQVEELLARRVAADVPAQEVGRALGDAVPDRIECRPAPVAQGSEQPRSEAERIGVLGEGAPVLAETDTTDERLGARVLHQAVEIDLRRLGARPLAQEHVATLDEAEAEPVGAALGLRPRVQGRAGREQRAGEVLRLVSEVRDEVGHDEAKLYVLYWAAVVSWMAHG